MATIVKKNAHGSGGWSGWIDLGSTSDLMRRIDRLNNCCVYQISLSSTAGSLTVSTNFAAQGYNYDTGYNVSTINAYLYTFDPTGSTTPPSGYVASTSLSDNLYNYGKYMSFVFSGLSVSGTVYVWFDCIVSSISSSGDPYYNAIWHYNTGNGHTQTPTATETQGGGGETQFQLAVKHDDGISKIQVSYTNGRYYDTTPQGWDRYIIAGGDTVYCDADVKDGYAFSKWMNAAGTDIVYTSRLTFSHFSGGTYTAYSVIGNYEVVLQAGANIASVSGDGIYAYQTEVTVTATLAEIENYNVTFVGWYEVSDSSEVLVSTDLNYTFNVPAYQKTLKAVAKAVPKGLVHIWDGSAWKDAMIFIYNGSAWQQYAPYIYDGSAWKLGG